MIQLDPVQKEIWTKNNLEHLRYEYDLNENSLVFDIGANEGVFLKEIYKLYHCNIEAYEPLKNHYDSLLKYEDNWNIIIWKFAVTGKPGDIYIDVVDESSLSKNKHTKEKCQSISINEIIVNNIDLMKINIEGGEYELLETITEENLKCIKNLQIQFHILNSESKHNRNTIHKKLLRTHRLTWEYPFCWENWRRNEL